MFLSCLCGSEPGLVHGVGTFAFLSCLCGSELIIKTKKIIVRFLSCLCGSEQTTEEVVTEIGF